MKKILIIVLHRPDRSPSQRFRFEQYLDYLEENGYSYTFSYLLNARDDHTYYSPGQWGDKFRIALKSAWIRLKDVWRASRYDLIFIQREAFMGGTALFERLFALAGPPMVFDFDDAIWLPHVSEANRPLRWLKSPRKVPVILTKSDLVLAGNDYLAQYARQFNPRVKVIPSTIDTTQYAPPKEHKSSGKTCIGWTGSPTTIDHLKQIIPVLARIKERFGKQVYFKVIGVPRFKSRLLNIGGKAWRARTEVRDLRELDIGLMPLPDKEWSRGKCGMKALQYMALGIPPVVSEVGMNKQLIQDGTNGFLADSFDEWIDKLSRLIESVELRQTLGERARQTVKHHYSVQAYRKAYLQQFDQLTASS